MPGNDLRVTLSPSWTTTAVALRSSRVRERMAAALTTAAGTIREDLADATPVRTGTMRASWRVDVAPSARLVKATITNRQSYAAFVVGGHRTRSGSQVPPNANLRAALDRVPGIAVDAARQVVGSVGADVARGGGS